MATGSVREKCRILFRFDARWWFFSASNQCRISIFSSDASFCDLEKITFLDPPKRMVQDCSLATWGRGTRYLAMWSGGEKRRIEVRFEVGCGFFSAANRSRTSIFSSDAPFPDFKKIRLFGPAETAMSGSALWLRRDEGAGIWPPGRAVKNVRLWSSLMQTYRFLVRPVNPAHRHLHRTRGL